MFKSAIRTLQKSFYKHIRRSLQAMQVVARPNPNEWCDYSIFRPDLALKFENENQREMKLTELCQ